MVWIILIHPYPNSDDLMENVVKISKGVPEMEVVAHFIVS